MRFVKPLDVDLVRELARTHDLLVTVEENAVAGGAGAAVAEALAALGIRYAVFCIWACPTRFIDHGDPRQDAGRLRPGRRRHRTQRSASG